MRSSLDVRINKRDLLVLAGLVVLSVGVYIAYSAIYHSVGFPLDDAWIHQTYARNLAEHGEWSFLTGKPSDGSTAPLWSALLALGYILRVPPLVWAVLLGAGALWGLSVLAESAVRRIVTTYRPRFPWAGAVLAVEWHLVWAAGSGMETLLYALLVTAVLVLLISNSRHFFGLGLLIGASIWVRPDGITLLGPAFLILAINQVQWKKRIKAILGLSMGAASLLASYLLFNLSVSGLPLPNTFYAKQAEYASYLQIPFIQRLASEALQPMIGVGIVLLPGLILACVNAIRKQEWSIPVAIIWLVGFLGLYAWRLPVTYQHGRYVIPAIPVYTILCLVGLVEFSQIHGKHFRWAVSIFWKLTVGITLFIFWGRGALAYAQDVAVIETEMVKTAKWVAVNVPPEAVVAAHDIGALGYFGGHDLVDLAGLVSPEVIPFLRDETQLAAYLNLRGVTYVVAFPDWYTSLTANLEPIYTTGEHFAPAFGEQNMAVYRWPGP